MTRRLLLAFLLIPLTAPAAAVPPQPHDATEDVHLQDITDVVKRSFDVEATGDLQLELDRGNIEVRTHDENTVLIEVERKARVNDRADAEQLFERHDVRLQQRASDDVFIESRYEEGGGWWWSGNDENKLRVTVRVVVPRGFDVEFSNGAGNVEVTGLDGDLDGRTGAGNIALTDLGGDVDIASGAGNVEITGVRGDADVATGAGNLQMTDLRGAVDASSGAGNVTATIVEQPGDDSSFSSGAGNVTVYLADGVGVYVDATASMGSASTDFPLEVEGRWTRRSFSGPVNGGGPDLSLSAGVGNVTLERRR